VNITQSWLFVKVFFFVGLIAVAIGANILVLAKGGIDEEKGSKGC
jgi:hypothetical protein